MASRAKLKAVPNIALTLITLIDEMELLRGRIAALVGKDAKHVELALAKDGTAFEVTITLMMEDDAQRIVYCLDSQPLDDMAFRAVNIAPALGQHRRRVVARIEAAQ